MILKAMPKHDIPNAENKWMHGLPMYCDLLCHCARQNIFLIHIRCDIFVLKCIQATKKSKFQTWLQATWFSPVSWLPHSYIVPSWSFSTHAWPPSVPPPPAHSVPFPMTPRRSVIKTPPMALHQYTLGRWALISQEVAGKPEVCRVIRNCAERIGGRRIA